MLKFNGERIVPEADNCEPLFALKMYQEHIARYLFAAQVARGRSALDIASGVGYGSQTLARCGAASVTAFDLSEDAVRHAQHFYPHPAVRYVVASAEDLPFTRCFDLITCFEAIEHMHRQHQVLREVARVLKDDGLLVMSTPRPTGTARSQFHTRELSLRELSDALQCYFPHIEWFFENNHFASFIANSAPAHIHAIHTLHAQFDLGQADYFIAVASRAAIDRSAFAPQLVLNDDGYVRNLERDVDILHRAEADFKARIQALEQELQHTRDAEQAEIGKSRELEGLEQELRTHIRVLRNELSTVQRRDNEQIDRILENNVQQRDHCNREIEAARRQVTQIDAERRSLQQELAIWRHRASEEQIGAQRFEARVADLERSLSWQITAPLRRMLDVWLSLRKRRTYSSPRQTSPPAESDIRREVPQRFTKKQFDIVYVIGCHDGESKRYRVHNIVDALTAAGYSAIAVPDNEIPDLIEEAITAKAFVLFRCAEDEPLKQLRDYCRSQSIQTIFDVDDLIFEPENIDLVRVVSTFDADGRSAYLDGVIRYRKALLACDKATCPTAYLAQRIDALGRPVAVIPNSLNSHQIAIAQQLESEKTPGNTNRGVAIGYFSGSNTHQVDFTACENALLKIMETHENVRFVLVGLLDLGAKWDRFAGRIECHPVLPYDEMLRLLADVDINIAPLELGNPYCESKSQLKIFEAGLVGVPTVASATASYREAIEHGIDGYIAANEAEWIEALEQLVRSREKRGTMGQAAKQNVFRRYSPDIIARQAVCAYGLEQTHERATEIVHSERSSPKPLHICWIVPGLIIGGGGHRNILRAAYYLERFGHDVELYFTSTDLTADQLRQEVWKHFYPMNCPIHRYEGAIHAADVLIATHWTTVDAAVRARESVGEIMYFVQDFEPAFAPMGTEYILAENTYRLGLYHITSGPWCERLLKNQFGCEADHFLFPVDTSVYHPRSRTKPGRNILFFAKPEMPRRCFELGIIALDEFHRLCPEVEIVLFGSRNVEAKHLPFPATLKLLLPAIEDLAALYCEADLGIVFSTTNPSLVPYEMMACGLPVLDLGRPGNEVNYGDRQDIAFLADPSPPIMARQLRDLLEDAAELARRARNGLEFVNAFPSEEQMARRVEQLICNRYFARRGLQEQVPTETIAGAAVAVQRDHATAE